MPAATKATRVACGRRIGDEGIVGEVGVDSERIHLGRRVLDVSPAGVVRFADGGEVSAGVIIAADGVHSTVRRALGFDSDAVFSGTIAVSESARWALHDHLPLERWHDGRVVLLGDAAHAMLPHQGQGANQTIEDAAGPDAGARRDRACAELPTMVGWIHAHDARAAAERMLESIHA